METDFDEWFRIEQEKLEKKFFDETKRSIEKGEDFIVPKKEFDRKFNNLMKDFEKKNYRQMRLEKWKKLLMKPIKNVNEGMSKFVKTFREE